MIDSRPYRYLLVGKYGSFFDKSTLNRQEDNMLKQEPPRLMLGERVTDESWLFKSMGLGAIFERGIILGVAVFTMSAELLNQYTTLLSWSHGFQESDPVARPLLSVSPILETALVLAIPVSLISTAYHTGLKWTDSSHRHKKAVTTTTPVVSTSPRNQLNNSRHQRPKHSPRLSHSVNTTLGRSPGLFFGPHD